MKFGDRYKTWGYIIEILVYHRNILYGIYAHIAVAAILVPKLGPGDEDG
jgi:hypothetical protein